LIFSDEIIHGFNPTIQILEKSPFSSANGLDSVCTLLWGKIPPVSLCDLRYCPDCLYILAFYERRIILTFTNQAAKRLGAIKNTFVVAAHVHQFFYESVVE